MISGQTFTLTSGGDFSCIECYKCGIPFLVRSTWREKRMEDCADFWCPNGHQQAYTESTLEKAKRKLEKEIQDKVRDINNMQGTINDLKYSEIQKEADIKKLTRKLKRCSKTK